MVEHSTADRPIPGSIPGFVLQYKDEKGGCGFFIQSCGKIYTETAILCGGICLYINAPVWLQLYDSYINYILPILLIPLCSITLLCRFVKQKQRLQQNVTWRQCRKMIIQITLISAVYMIFDLPAVIVFVVQVSGHPTFGNDIWFPYLARMTLVPSIMIPFVTLLALPKLKMKLGNLCFWKHNQRAVFPGNSSIAIAITVVISCLSIVTGDGGCGCIFFFRIYNLTHTHAHTLNSSMNLVIDVTYSYNTGSYSDIGNVNHFEIKVTGYII
ncbi:hypothetical protein I4U23_011400 [Adineta vaga]|nr:hypothetical protein I4U23_011400 [Adineta vaga]